MSLKNIHIKILSNNIFIIISEKNNKVIKLESMGSIGFKHKEKKILEGFKILINQFINYFKNNRWRINILKISGAVRFKLKVIRTFIESYFIRWCKIIEKNSYNGCRLKKKKRKKRKLKIKIYKKF